MADQAASLLMPTTGPSSLVPGDATNASGFRSPFQKANEKASAGYYSVLLDKYNIRAELTATTRGWFPPIHALLRRTTLTLSSDAGHLLGEAGSYGWGGPESRQVLWSFSIEILSPTELQGYTIALPLTKLTGPTLEKEIHPRLFCGRAQQTGVFRMAVTGQALTMTDRRRNTARGCAPILILKLQNNEVMEIKVAVSLYQHGTSLVNLESRGRLKIFSIKVRRRTPKHGIPELSKIEVEVEERKKKQKSNSTRRFTGSY